MRCLTIFFILAILMFFSCTGKNPINSVPVDSLGFTTLGSPVPDKHKKIKGDVNGDKVIDLSDVVYLINYLFNDGPAPIKKSGDINKDKVVDIVDVVMLINYIFY